MATANLLGTCIILSFIFLSHPASHAGSAEPGPEATSSPVTCEAEARRQGETELRRNIARLRCERELLVDRFQESSNAAREALDEFISTGISLQQVREKMRTEGAEAPCPNPGIFNASTGLCKDLEAKYVAQIETNGQIVKSTQKMIKEVGKPFNNVNNELASRIEELVNDSSVKRWAAGVLAVMFVSSVVAGIVMIVRNRQNTGAGAPVQLNARWIVGPALFFALAFGCLVDRIPESLIVAVLGGASGWLFGTTRS